MFLFLHSRVETAQCWVFAILNLLVIVALWVLLLRPRAINDVLTWLTADTEFALPAEVFEHHSAQANPIPNEVRAATSNHSYHADHYSTRQSIHDQGWRARLQSMCQGTAGCLSRCMRRNIHRCVGPRVPFEDTPLDAISQEWRDREQHRRAAQRTKHASMLATVNYDNLVEGSARQPEGRGLTTWYFQAPDPSATGSDSTIGYNTGGESAPQPHRAAPSDASHLAVRTPTTVRSRDVPQHRLRVVTDEASPQASLTADGVPKRISSVRRHHPSEQQDWDTSEGGGSQTGSQGGVYSIASGQHAPAAPATCSPTSTRTGDFGGSAEAEDEGADGRSSEGGADSRARGASHPHIPGLLRGLFLPGHQESMPVEDDSLLQLSQYSDTPIQSSHSVLKSIWTDLVGGPAPHGRMIASVMSQQHGRMLIAACTCGLLSVAVLPLLFCWERYDRSGDDICEAFESGFVSAYWLLLCALTSAFVFSHIAADFVTAVVGIVLVYAGVIVSVLVLHLSDGPNPAGVDDSLVSVVVISLFVIIAVLLVSLWSAARTEREKFRLWLRASLTSHDCLSSFWELVKADELKRRHTDDLSWAAHKLKYAQ